MKKKNFDYTDFGVPTQNLERGDFSSDKPVGELFYECPVTATKYGKGEGKYVSADGLGQLVQAGIEAFEEKHGAHFPGNLIWSDMSNQLMVGSSPFRWRGGFVSPEGFEKLMEEYARIGGWLRAAADLRGVSRLIEKTQSPNGVGSPYTTVVIEDLIKKFPSPGRLERLIWKTLGRAKAILKGYQGDHAPAWVDIADSLLKTAKPGKAAIILVAKTLAATWGGYPYRGRAFGSYAKARNFLVSISQRYYTIQDNSDGVEALRQQDAFYTRCGIQVYRIRLEREFGRFEIQWLVQAINGRTYHFEPREDSCPQDAVSAAIYAWREQDRLAKMNADLIGYLNGENGTCPLITYQDSRDAGNCHEGTMGFMRQMGWEDRDFVPGIYLIPHLGDERVRRVVQKRYEVDLPAVAQVA